MYVITSRKVYVHTFFSVLRLTLCVVYDRLVTSRQSIFTARSLLLYLV